jgi:hypothetical protein
MNMKQWWNDDWQGKADKMHKIIDALSGQGYRTGQGRFRWV